MKIETSKQEREHSSLRLSTGRKSSCAEGSTDVHYKADRLDAAIRKNWTKHLKTALKAAASVAREREFFIIGSQAVHPHCTRPPAEVLLSQECDLYPCNRPEAAPLLARELGRNSAFGRKHGFYVDVVTPDIAALPEGWQKRVKQLRYGRITAYCGSC